MKISQLQKIMRRFPPEAVPTDPAWRNAFIRHIGLEPSDLYQELEMESLLVDTHLDISYADAHVNLHSHNFYELLCCVNTCDVEYLVGADRYRLQRGDILLIPPGVSHRPLLPERMAEPYTRQVLWISTELMEKLQPMFPELCAPEPIYSVMLRTADTPWEHLTDLFQKGITEAEKQAPSWELALLGNTITLLASLRRAFLDRASGTLKEEKPELLDRILFYLENHLAEKITLAEVAHQFYVSSSTVGHLFKQKLGVSFYRYVTQRRLIAAKTLIERGLLLEDVSAQTGFADYSGFYRAFKQEFGISPRQYRSLQEGNGRNLP